MAEVIVVSAIVLAVVGTLFISYNKIYRSYNKRIGYYDSVTLYRLEYYRNILIENNIINDLLRKTKTSVVTSIYDSKNGFSSGNVFTLPNSEKPPENVADRVFLMYITKRGDNKIGGIEDIISSNADSAFEYNVSETFKDYLKYVETSVTFKSHYAMFMERCEESEGNIDDCKYAYLEIYDGYE